VGRDRREHFRCLADQREMCGRNDRGWRAHRWGWGAARSLMIDANLRDLRIASGKGPRFTGWCRRSGQAIAWAAPHAVIAMEDVESSPLGEGAGFQAGWRLPRSAVSSKVHPLA
jgi:hypothetical protein